MLNYLKLFAGVALLSSVAACAEFSFPASSGQPQLSPQVTEEPENIASVTPSTNFEQSGIAAFVGSTLAAKLSPAAQKKAVDAQYFALQFGRTGAPRGWVDSKRENGSVTTGPFVRVNQLDCRDYSHKVIIDGQTFLGKGTACRNAAGEWEAVKLDGVS